MISLLRRRATLAPPLDDMPVSDTHLIGKAAQEERTDVIALAERMGLTVIKRPMRHEIAGELTRAGRHWRIEVNSDHAETRRRFTIAHEIAHYAMHRDLIGLKGPIACIVDGRDYRQPSDMPTVAAVTAHHETQANQMAIMILMGRDKMNRLVEKGLDAEAIATRIGCTVEAVRIRLEIMK